MSEGLSARFNPSNIALFSIPIGYIYHKKQFRASVSGFLFLTSSPVSYQGKTHSLYPSPNLSHKGRGIVKKYLASILADYVSSWKFPGAYQSKICKNASITLGLNWVPLFFLSSRIASSLLSGLR